MFRSYANGIRTASGGTHENGFKAAIVRAIRNFMATHEASQDQGVEDRADDIREGIVGILSVFVREPQFQGQTKERLHNPEMAASVENFVRPALEAWLNSNMTAADQIVGRIVLAAKARAASARRSPRSSASRPVSAASTCPASCRLPFHRPQRNGTVHRRGRLGRRFRQAGPRQRQPRPCCPCAARSSTPKGWP